VIELTALTWGVLITGALLVGIAKTALPGLATFVAAMFAAVLPARESTAVLLVLLMTGDLVAIWVYRRDADFRTLLRLAPPVIAGLVLGATFLAWADNTTMRRTIGVILLLLVAITLIQRRSTSRRASDGASATQASPPAPTLEIQKATTTLATPTTSGRLSRLVYGSLAGFTTMVANAGGPVTSMYFLACRYPVKAFLGTTAWFFFLVNLVKLPFSISAGLVNTTTMSLTVICAPIVIVSALAGRRLAERMDQRVFEPVIVALTIISALPLLR